MQHLQYHSNPKNPKQRSAQRQPPAELHFILFSGQLRGHYALHRGTLSETWAAAQNLFPIEEISGVYSIKELPSIKALSPVHKITLEEALELLQWSIPNA